MGDPGISATPILIVGAGPTGLVLALSLARRGVSFRIVDAADGPGLQSRAMAVHARTLEFYRQFGFADEVVKAGVIAERIHVSRGGSHGRRRDAATFRLGAVGEGLSPYPYVLTYPQDDHERLLVGQLEALGVRVEWRTGLTGFTQTADHVAVSLDHDGVAHTADVAWLIGCDGAHSVVRRSMEIGFSGGTYDQLFYVADVEIEGGFDKDVYVNLGEQSLALMMPVRSRGVQRLIGLVPVAYGDREDVAFEDIRGDVEALVGVTVAKVNWFSTYRVHHRVADRFRVGRAFIAGDAGHIHSPAGGQGMNTGIGDAVNLGWKLADVARGRGPETLLDSYETERLPFARRLVATTDRAFEGLVAGGARGEFIRTRLAPALVGIAAALTPTRRLAFRTVSQIGVHYRDSALSEGRAGVHGGDRLPWVESGVGGSADDDNFAPLRSLDWQVHVHGVASPDVADACERIGAPLIVRSWTARARDAGLRRDALYLVRPDGYIALAAGADGAARLLDYVERRGLKLERRTAHAAGSRNSSRLPKGSST